MSNVVECMNYFVKCGGKVGRHRDRRGWGIPPRSMDRSPEDSHVKLPATCLVWSLSVSGQIFPLIRYAHFSHFQGHREGATGSIGPYRTTNA